MYLWQYRNNKPQLDNKITNHQSNLRVPERNHCLSYADYSHSNILTVIFDGCLTSDKNKGLTDTQKPGVSVVTKTLIWSVCFLYF